MSSMSDVPTPPLGLSYDDPFLGLPPSYVETDKIAIIYYAFTFGLFTWEMLTTMLDDYRLIIRKQMSATAVLYILGRYLIWTFLLLSLLFQTTPLPDCQAAISTIGALYGLAQPCIASIFIVRTVAVWNRSRPIVILGAAMFLAILGIGISIPFGLGAARIPGYKHCTNTSAKSWLTVSLALTMSNDFIMLILFLYKVIQRTDQQGFHLFRLSSWNRFPALTQLLAKQGIFYWVVTLVFNILALVLLADQHVNPIFHTTHVNLLAAIEAALAGRMFREVRSFAGSGTNNKKAVNLDALRQRSEESASLPAHMRDNMLMRTNSQNSVRPYTPHPPSAGPRFVMERSRVAEDMESDACSTSAPPIGHKTPPSPQPARIYPITQDGIGSSPLPYRMLGPSTSTSEGSAPWHYKE